VFHGRSEIYIQDPAAYYYGGVGTSRLSSNMSIFL
jgi:hypothetical protein